MTPNVLRYRLVIKSQVFEPIMEKAPKLSAEEIEMGLIMPNCSLAQLHVKLLKVLVNNSSSSRCSSPATDLLFVLVCFMQGIPPVSKAVDYSDAWVTILRKKLNAWWPWVSQL